MKKFKGILSLALAVVMSNSLFACKDDEVNLKPVEGEIEQVVDGNQIYDVLADRMSPKLAYSKDKNYKSWKKEVKEKFIELFGMKKFEANACPLNVKIEETKKFEAETKEGDKPTPAYTRYRILFNSEYGATVLCYLLIPDTGKDSYPLAITLQGHSGHGVYYSIGDVESDDPEVLDYLNRGDFAIQAVQQGYAALAIEQRGMSDRYADSSPEGASMCEYAANQELILGRTILGGRIWDVSKAIDALDDGALSSITSKINKKDITITGSSGGGTASYYAACYDERITVAAPNCGFCNFKDSIMNTYHCSCNFVPGIYEWFDMQDLACLIAPRKLVIVSGVTDTIFPIKGVDEAFETVQAIYKAADAENNCVQEVTNKGHYWVEDKVWPAINAIRA